MKTVLFVCSGNTCRSPMAACLFNALCQRDGRKDLAALSAGTGAMSGMGASQGARHAMERRGLSLREHRSRPVTVELLEGVWLAVGMSPWHIAALQARFPRSHTAMSSFDPPIADPYGGDDQTYEQTAKELEPQVAALYQLVSLE